MRTLPESTIWLLWRLLLWLGSALRSPGKGQDREQLCVTLVAIVATDRAAVLLDQALRELRHHEPSNLLARSVIVEIARMTINTLNSKRFADRVHHFHQPFARDALQHLDIRRLPA